MKKTIALIVAVVFLYTHTSITIAQAPVRNLNQYTIPELAEHFASQYSVSAPKMLATMKCESSFNPKAIGDHGTSYGLSQIHLPAHPQITKTEAQDPVFAVEFMAKEFSQHHENIWSCYQEIYG